MKNLVKIALFSMSLCTLNAYAQKNEKQMLDQNQSTTEKLENRKLTIYQTLVRHFGNKNTTNKFYGSIEENGSGKFNDIT
ncbi:MAG: alpha-amylase, partial [Flavobacterium sp.]